MPLDKFSFSRSFFYVIEPMGEGAQPEIVAEHFVC